MKNSDSKSNYRKKDKRIYVVIFGICIFLIVVAICILAWVLKKPDADSREESTIYAEGELCTENSMDSEEIVSEEESAAQEENVSEQNVESVTEQRQKIIDAWETIPAGTVVESANVDLERVDCYFVSYEISEEIFNIINGKSYQENPYVKLEDLRYMKVLHYNFEHELQVGELIVATDLQDDFINIFKELFQAEYEIQSLYLIDNYWTGDPTDTDTASIDENNSSCFMYRPATGSSKLSNHSYGRAIDINPQQNPYVSYRTGEPVWYHENANDYIDRDTGLAHVITQEDICYQIFIKYGFSWGGSWNTVKDYQHFEKE